MKHVRSVGKYAALFALVLALLYLFLVITALIPNEAIATNMEKSALSYREKGAFVENDEEGRLSSIEDNYADTILLNIAWQMGKGNPFTSVLDTGYYDGDSYGESVGLYFAVTEDAVPNMDYSRYWHGNAAFVRMFHLFSDVTFMRLAIFVILLLVVLLDVILLIKKRHSALALCLLASLILGGIAGVRLSLEYQAPFIVTCLMIPFYIRYERSESHLIALSVIGGTMVAFFDFLTTETLTILLPLILVVGLRGKEGGLRPLKKELPWLLKCLIGWGASYVGTFLAKWTLATAVSGENKFSVALSAAEPHFAGSADEIEGSFRPIQGILANFSVLFGSTERVDVRLVLMGILAVGLIFFLIWYASGRKTGEGMAISLLLGALVLVRYVVLNSHSYRHCFFTYRALTVLIFALFVALILPGNKRSRKKRRN